MGTILSNQNLNPSDKNNPAKNTKTSQHWEVLERTIDREILKSNKTSLIVERYSFQMENYEDFQAQNKLFQWRNHNPNSQFMVNILSVGKDDSASEDSTFQCGSIEWCPSEKVRCKIFVVTERILKLGEINEVLKFQREMEDCTENNRNKVLYATEETQKKSASAKKIQKIQPFVGINFSQSLARQLLKDWIRSIEVLCYKFGYFNISREHLGMTVHKRGTSWISSNYALNHLYPEDKIQVSTAEQKFKFEKQTIQKLMNLTQNIPCFTNTVYALKQRNIERFDDFCNLIDQITKAKKHNRHVTSHQPETRNVQNNSLYVEHASFLAPNNRLVHNNSSFFMFDRQSALNRVHSNTKINSHQKIVSLEASLQKKNSRQLLHPNNLIEPQGRFTKRSNTGQKVSMNLSPQSRQQLNFVSSNHKYCGKQTAPTNELGHSSSLQSVNHGAPLKGNFEELQTKRLEGKTMFKSQNNTKVQPILSNQKLMQKATSPNKIYFHHNVKHSFSSEPHIFRSHAANDLKSPRSPKPNQNMSFNSPNPRSNNLYHNFSLDENNIVGPYRKDRVYSNLRKEKIALVDSMVMVREQSQEVEEDLHNLSKGKYVLEESIIIMGRDDDHILSDIYL